MFMRLLPLIAGLLPILGANGAFWLSVHHEVLPACVPYLEGCTSISAAGRYPPGSFLFRAVHLPYAALLTILWYFNYAWLGVLEGEHHAVRRKVMFSAGLVSSVALIIYVTFLGTTEPVYEFMRRGGIYFYFLSMSIAQIATSLAMLKIDKPLARWMLLACLLPFALGVLNLVQKEVLPYEVADKIENQIEWIAALSMHIWLLILYVAWRRTAFDTRVTAIRMGSTNVRQ